MFSSMIRKLCCKEDEKLQAKDFTKFDLSQTTKISLVETIKFGDIALVKESINSLIKHGKNVTRKLNTTDRRGFNAIHYAVHFQFWDILYLLLEYADKRTINQISSDYITPLIIFLYEDAPNRETLTRCLGFHEKILTAILMKGADPNLTELSSFFPLLLVLKRKQWKYAQILLEFGANPMGCDGLSYYDLPIYHAFADMETLRMLISKCSPANLSMKIKLKYYFNDFPLKEIDVYEFVKIILDHEMKSPDTECDYYRLAASLIGVSFPAFRYCLQKTNLYVYHFIYVVTCVGRKYSPYCQFSEELGIHLLRFLREKKRPIEAATYFLATFEGSVKLVDYHLENIAEAGYDLKGLRIDLSPSSLDIKTLAPDGSLNLLSSMSYTLDLTVTTVYLARKLLALGLRVSLSAYTQVLRAFKDLMNPSQDEKDFLQEIFMSLIKDRNMRSSECVEMAVHFFVNDCPIIKGFLQHGVPVDKCFYRNRLKYGSSDDVSLPMKLFLERFIAERPRMENNFLKTTLANPAETKSRMWSLKHHCRIAIRKSFCGVNLFEKIDSIGLPDSLVSYLKFEDEKLEIP